MTSHYHSPRTDESIEHEHRTLRRIHERVSKSISRSHSESMPDGLPALLGELADTLDTHFEHEETGGYFLGVVERAPRLSESVETLKQQHADFRRTIRRLRELANRQGTGPSDWQQIKTGCKEFIAQLLAHETAENELLQEAYVQDIGEED